MTRPGLRRYACRIRGYADRCIDETTEVTPAIEGVHRTVPTEDKPTDGKPADDKKRAVYRALQDRILNGAGSASPDQRARAFANSGLAQPLAGLLDKVATRPAQVTDADFAAARAAGCSEDELFELVVCAAVGQSARLYDAGLAALAGALAGEGGR